LNFFEIELANIFHQVSLNQPFLVLALISLIPIYDQFSNQRFVPSPKYRLL
jgi:hypothetical protein